MGSQAGLYPGLAGSHLGSCQSHTGSHPGLRQDPGWDWRDPASHFYLGRQKALDIFYGLAFEDESHKKVIDIVFQKLEEFCVGNKNEIYVYQRYLFNKRDQAADNSIVTYVAALRSLAKTCNYQG